MTHETAASPLSTDTAKRAHDASQLSLPDVIFGRVQSALLSVVVGVAIIVPRATAFALCLYALSVLVQEVLRRRP
ncbi:MAG: hypothetical protein AAFO79_10025, partial [Pseudomonadota bacterium]